MTSVFKNMARAGAAILVSALLAFASLPATPIAAYAANDPYTFTVTLLAGQQGALDGSGYQVYPEGVGNKPVCDGEKLVLSGLPYGAQVSFFNNAASVDADSKYYVKGVRLSGRDNSTAENAAPSFTVTQDSDYVVAYGMKGNLVNYTVRYVDTDGNELAPANTYYGNVGDAPVVVYLYMDGYRPQAYNLTGTLKANAGDNVFTFEYTRLAEPEAPVVETVVVPTTTETEAAAGAAVSAAPVVAVTPPAEETYIADDGTPLAAPQDIINIDDDENPLASGVGDGSHAAFSENGSSMILWPTIASGVILLAGIVLIVLWLVRRKRDKDQGLA